MKGKGSLASWKLHPASPSSAKTRTCELHAAYGHTCTAINKTGPLTFNELLKALWFLQGGGPWYRSQKRLCYIFAVWGLETSAMTWVTVWCIIYDHEDGKDRMKFDKTQSSAVTESACLGRKGRRRCRIRSSRLSLSFVFATLKCNVKVGLLACPARGSIEH